VGQPKIARHRGHDTLGEERERLHSILRPDHEGRSDGGLRRIDHGVRVIDLLARCEGTGGGGVREIPEGYAEADVRMPLDEVAGKERPDGLDAPKSVDVDGAKSAVGRARTIENYSLRREDRLGIRDV